MVVHNGEECWTASEVMEELYIYDGGDLRRFIKQGMPHIVCNKRYLFPKERVHAWFRGDTREVKRRDKNIILLSWGKVMPLIKAKGITPTEFFRNIGVSLNCLKRMKRGENLRISTAQKIAAALGVDVKDLVEGK